MFQKDSEAIHTSSYIMLKLLTMTYTSICNIALSQLKDEYEDNKLFRAYENPIQPYHVKHKRLYIEDLVCVSKGPVRRSILHICHESSIGVNREENKTYNLLKRNLFWSQTKREIKNT